MDSIKFSGGIVAGLSLMSSRIVRLTLASPEDISPNTPDVVTQNSDDNTNIESLIDLPRVIEFVAVPRSLYVLSGVCRYRYAHSVLAVNTTDLLTTDFTIERRMSLICRDALM